MPTLELPDMEMHYVVDDFTDPWSKPETILMLHGNAESALATLIADATLATLRTLSALAIERRLRKPLRLTIWLSMTS